MIGSILASLGLEHWVRQRKADAAPARGSVARWA